MTFISFTRTDLDEAIAAAQAGAHTTRQQERVAKAVAWLSSWGGDAWTLKTNVITIRSATSGDVYTLTLCDGFMEHQCKSRRPCWHETLGSIIMAAAQLCEDRTALAYGVWSSDLSCCGGQGCHLCMVTVTPAIMPARAPLTPAVVIHEADYEVIPW